MFEPTVSTPAVTTAPMEVADAVGDVVRARVVRSAGRESKWWSGGITGLMEKATIGLVSTALWSVIEITDFALRHGRNKGPWLSLSDLTWGYSELLHALWQAQKHLMSRTWP